MSVHYAPGSDFALVRPGLVVLVDASVGTAVVADLWAAVVAAEPSGETNGPGLATLLDAVTGVLDPTWRTLPSFAIAIVGGDAGRGAAQVAVRGTFAAAVTSPETTEHVSGPTVMTWVDKKVDDVVCLELTSRAQGGATAEASPVLTIAEGIVQVETLRWDVLELPGDLDGPDLADVSDLADLVDAGELLDQAGAREDADDATVTEDESSHDGPAIADDDHPTVDTGGTGTRMMDTGSAAGQVDALSPVQLAESDFAQTLAGVPEEWDEESPEPEGATDEESEPDDGDLVGDDDFDDSTVFVADLVRIKDSMPAAEPAAPAEVAPAPAPAPAPAAAPGLAWPRPNHLPGPVPPPPPPPPAPKVPSAPSPSPSPSSLPAPQPTSQPVPWPVEPFREVTPPGTEVLARSCFFGHANPPARTTCAQCGGGLSPNAQLVERPSLGRVEVSTGESVDLSVPVVVGRFPQAQPTSSPVAQRLVTVPSPSQDISRSHLEVRLDGWHVLVVDLDTVNGTTLLREGQAPRRLHPLEPTLVGDGDAADLGDGITLTFRDLA